jgi:hypothetical protein
MLAAGLSAAPLFASTPFWEKKAPKDWTNDEIDKLTTNSPWAKEVTAQVPNRETSSGYPSGGGGGGGRSTGIGIGIPGLGGIGQGSGRRGGPSRTNMQVKITVAWQSAQPIVDAVKPEFPDGFANHYVILVSGFPWPPVPEPNETRSTQIEYQLDDLKQLTYLRPEPGDALQPAIVDKPFSTGETMLFGFSKARLPLSTDIKEVVFTTRFGKTPVQAKFIMKDMLYHGELAV